MLKKCVLFQQISHSLSVHHFHTSTDLLNKYIARSVKIDMSRVCISILMMCIYVSHVCVHVVAMMLLNLYLLVLMYM